MTIKKIKNLRFQILDLEYLQSVFLLSLLIILLKDMYKKLIMVQKTTSIMFSVISIRKFIQDKSIKELQGIIWIFLINLWKYIMLKNPHPTIIQMKEIEINRIKGKLLTNQKIFQSVHLKSLSAQIFNHYPKIDNLWTKNRQKKKIGKELVKIK